MNYILMYYISKEIYKQDINCSRSDFLDILCEIMFQGAYNIYLVDRDTNQAVESWRVQNE